MSTINCFDNNISQNIFFGTAWGTMMTEFSSNIHIAWRDVLTDYLSGCQNM